MSALVYRATIVLVIITYAAMIYADYANGRRGVGVPRGLRAVTGRLWAQLAWVVSRDEDEVMLRNSRRWPPPEPTPEQKAEGDRLRVLGDRFHYRALEQGFTRQGTDHCFGRDPQDGPLFAPDEPTEP